jgi:hypothetical protein
MKADDTYIRSLGFIPCEFGCGGWVHPNPSDPSAGQAIWNHLCLPKLKVTLDSFFARRAQGQTRMHDGSDSDKTQHRRDEQPPPKFCPNCRRKNATK